MGDIGGFDEYLTIWKGPKRQGELVDGRRVFEWTNSDIIDLLKKHKVTHVFWNDKNRFQGCLGYGWHSIKSLEGFLKS